MKLVKKYLDEETQEYVYSYELTEGEKLILEAAYGECYENKIVEIINDKIKRIVEGLE